MAAESSLPSPHIDGQSSSDPLLPPSSSLNSATSSPSTELRTNGTYVYSSNNSNGDDVSDIAEVYRQRVLQQQEQLALNGDNDNYSSSSSSLTNNKSKFDCWGSVANLCSATLGAGVLALPVALYQAGLVVGMLMLSLSAYATIQSIEMLVDACAYYQAYSYERLVEVALGKGARTVTEAALVVFCGGCAVAYVIAVGDILEESGLLEVLFKNYDTDGRSLAMIIVWTVAMLPLSLQRTMHSLQWASAVGICSIGTLVLAAFVHYLQDSYDVADSSSNTTVRDTLNSTYYHFLDDHLLGSTDGLLFNSTNGTSTSIDGHYHLKDFLWPATDNSSSSRLISILTACPIVLFAFSCQVNVCAIFQELPSSDAAVNSDNQAQQMQIANQKNKIRLMNQVTLRAVMICSFLYSMISLVTLADFGNSVTANILSRYNSSNDDSDNDEDEDVNNLMQAAAAFMGVAVTLAFPLNVFPARVALMDIWHRRQQQRAQFGNGEDESSNSTPEESLMTTLLPTTSATTRSNVGANNEGIDPPVGANEANNVGTGGDDAVDEVENPLMTDVTDGGTTAHEDDTLFSWPLHVGLTLAIAGSALCLALALPNISVVFGVLGGTTTSMLGFCIPGALGLHLGREIQSTTGVAPELSRVVASWMLLIGGVVFGVVTTGVTVWGLLQ